ncbi:MULTISPECIES: hypothetical protein [unclassified Exiguobacterium]|uniref:hypothetical protein n=1 Tax=unclassified Exiguobacterium TaxID=2644629 RepID=UPI001BE76CEC|nr:MULTISPECIES: hypothetical protein [unclassified Exiguobacterium]
MYKTTLIAPTRMGQSVFREYQDWLMKIQSNQNIEIVAVNITSRDTLIVTYKEL